MNIINSLEVGLGVLGALLGYDLIIMLINFIRRNVEIKRIDNKRKA